MIPNPARWRMDLNVLLAAGVWCVAGHDLLGSADFVVDDSLHREAVRHKMSPMLHRYSAQRSEIVPEALSAISDVFAIVSSDLFLSADCIIRGLQGRNVETALIKGPDLILTCYDSALPRIINDFDVLIRPEDVHTTSTIMRQLGYRQGRLLRDNLSIEEGPDAASQTPQDYELAPFLKIQRVPHLDPYLNVIHTYLPEYSFMERDGEAYYAQEFDMHFNLAADIELSDVWTNARSLTLPSGTATLGLAPSTCLWFLASRAYHQIMLDCQGSIRMFVDVLAIVRRLHEKIDWDALCTVTRKYGLYPSLFYMLAHCNEFLGPLVPEQVLSFCRPGMDTRERYHDWGDFIPKLLGFVQLSSALPLQLHSDSSI